MRHLAHKGSQPRESATRDHPKIGPAVSVSKYCSNYTLVVTVQNGQFHLVSDVMVSQTVPKFNHIVNGFAIDPEQNVAASDACHGRWPLRVNRSDDDARLGIIFVF
jgi:hypothetical protein